MSGGHFDYKSYRIAQFAEELQHEIEINDDLSKNEYGETIGYGFRKETIDRLKTVQRMTETSGRLAKEAEWLYSGDHGERTFQSVIDKILIEQPIGQYIENLPDGHKTVEDCVRHLEEKIDSLYDTIEDIQHCDCPQCKRVKGIGVSECTDCGWNVMQ